MAFDVLSSYCRPTRVNIHCIKGVDKILFDYVILAITNTIKRKINVI